MSLIAVNSLAAFKQQLAGSSGRLVVLMYVLPTCRACQSIMPAIVAKAAAQPDVLFLVCDISVAPDLRSWGKIKATPTFQFFVACNPVPVAQFAGASEAKLDELIVKYKPSL